MEENVKNNFGIPKNLWQKLDPGQAVLEHKKEKLLNKKMHNVD